MKHGIYKDIPLAEYRASSSYGSSDLKAMRQGIAAMVPWRRAHPDESSDAMRVGTAAHCRILEPLAFSTRYVAKPEKLSFATTVGKEWRAQVPEGVIILTHDEAQKVEQIAEAFHSKAAAIASFRGAIGVESSAFWSDVDTGLPLKGRPDWYGADEIVDLKISRWAGTSLLPMRAYSEGWCHQLALYQAGLAECGHVVSRARLVVINPEPPQQFRVCCVEIKQDALSMVHLDNERTIAAMSECHTSGVWPGVAEEWTKIDLPSFAQTELLHVDWGDDADTPLTARGPR